MPWIPGGRWASVPEVTKPWPDSLTVSVPSSRPFWSRIVASALPADVLALVLAEDPWWRKRWRERMGAGTVSDAWQSSMVRAGR